MWLPHFWRSIPKKSRNVLLPTDERHMLSFVKIRSEVSTESILNKAFVTNLSLVGSMVIDVRMTCERDPV